LKALFTAYLLTMAIGYFMAFFYLFLINIAPHQKMGMEVLEGIVHMYYGKKGDTRLESALKGSMGEYVSKAEKEKIFNWISNGGGREKYTEVQPIFDNNCVECHSSLSGMNLVPFTTYEEIKNVMKIDFGESIKTLARVSHVHFFGISFIFIWTSLIFSFCSIKRYLKITIILTPFIAIWLDIGSWWLTKYEPVFAYTVIIGGGFMGVSFAIQILYSLYEMWLRKKTIPAES
jgi:hypothetical protein